MVTCGRDPPPVTARQPPHFGFSLAPANKESLSLPGYGRENPSRPVSLLLCSYLKEIHMIVTELDVEHIVLDLTNLPKE